jgi:hypothetical protein
LIAVYGIDLAANNNFRLYPNATNNITSVSGTRTNSTGTAVAGILLQDYLSNNTLLSGNTTNIFHFTVNNYSDTSMRKTGNVITRYFNSSSSYEIEWRGITFDTTSAIDSLTFDAFGTTFNGGTILLYGVK